MLVKISGLCLVVLGVSHPFNLAMGKVRVPEVSSKVPILEE